MPWKDKTSHQAIINWPHLTVTIPGLLITAEEMLIIQRGTLLMPSLPAKAGGGREKKECGIKVILDVLIAAFHFGNEHLMLRRD